MVSCPQGTRYGLEGRVNQDFRDVRLPNRSTLVFEFPNVMTETDTPSSARSRKRQPPSFGRSARMEPTGFTPTRSAARSPIDGRFNELPEPSGPPAGLRYRGKPAQPAVR
jgi:hypothetical protein